MFNVSEDDVSFQQSQFPKQSCFALTVHEAQSTDLSEKTSIPA